MPSVERLSNDEQPEIDPNLGHEANQVGGNEEEVTMAAMDQNRVQELLDQHVEDEVIELQDLIDDYPSESLTKVELTEFSSRLDEIRNKLKDVRQG